MLGFLITVLFSLGAAGIGLFLFRRWLPADDSAARIGASGLLGLGTVGLATLFLGLLPNGLIWGLYPVLVAGAAGLYALYREYRRERWSLARPAGAEILFPIVVGVALLFAVIGALAPPVTMEWDSIAYHLAVPKIWIQAGSIHYIPFIHHSNFPFTVDNLFLWGLRWGEGEAGAKGFSPVLFGFGILTIFGLARSLYGPRAAWWAALAFATVPVVLWLSGTAYIDVPHGLYAGLGIVFAGRYLLSPRREELVMAGLMLGFAAGSKYTGLQTILAVALVLFVFSAVARKAREGFLAAAAVGTLAMLVSGPWYVKNVLWTGNPVYPFFYEAFGGRNWSERHAEIYRGEQATFGVGQGQPLQAGHAILGLAYQPGRYVNPGQDRGLGTPLGAVGVPVVAVLVVWLASGRARRFEASLLAAVLVSLAMWVVLSQQSRYITMLAPPLVLLLGGGVVRLRAGPVLMGAAALQAIWSLYLVNTLLVSDQLRAVLGVEPREAYLSRRVAFYAPAQRINALGPDVRVALYDEVFGYFLDVPYFWANPGHSDLIPYDRMEGGQDFAREMRALGFTHAYVNLAAMGTDGAARWLAAAGLTEPARPFEGEERQGLMASFELRYRVLLAEAVSEGRVRLEESFGRSLLFRIQEEGR